MDSRLRGNDKEGELMRRREGLFAIHTVPF
jgi:hypothetical protein